MYIKKSFLVIIILILAAAFLLLFVQNSSRESHINEEYVNAEEFGAAGGDDKDDSGAIQAAINFSAKEKIGKVKLSGNHHFILKNGIKVKEGVKVELGENTKIFVEGNFRAFELMKNASIENGTIEVTKAEFASDVIYLNGKERFWSHERTRIHNVAIINSSGTNSGKAISLYSKGADHFISFVNFSDINISGFEYGIHILSEKYSDDQFSFINGNRFTNITLDDCLTCIHIDSSITIPNESSGNQFTGVQLQLTEKTERAIYVSGSDNFFEAMIWDPQVAEEGKPLVEFSKSSMRSYMLTNLDSDLVKDDGDSNRIAQYSQQ